MAAVSPIKQICGNSVCTKTNEEVGRKFQVCGRCRTVAYCSPSCQRTAWPHHATLCKTIACQLGALKGARRVVPNLKLRSWKAFTAGSSGLQGVLSQAPMNFAAAEKFSSQSSNAMGALLEEMEEISIRTSSERLVAAQRGGSIEELAKARFAHLKLFYLEVQESYATFPDGQKTEEKEVLAQMRERINHPNPTAEDLGRMDSDFATLQKLNLDFLTEALRLAKLNSTS